MLMPIVWLLGNLFEELKVSLLRSLVALDLLNLPIKEAQKGNILRASWTRSLYTELKFGTQRYL